MPLPISDTPDSNQYIYDRRTTSQEIRLLILLPCLESQDDQSVRCELVTVPLAESPPFAALSYTWGEDVFPKSLIIEGKILKITQNLYEALVRFRLPDRPLAVWVDSVCISQGDGDEKNIQLPLMGQIYTQATEVLIWLGEETEESKGVMLYLLRIGQKFADRGGEILEPRHERSPDNDALWAEVTTDPNFEKTHLIWERTWFSRRWIIQEMALARCPIVRCGGLKMKWSILIQAAQALVRLRGDGSQFWNRATNRPIQLGAKSLLGVLKLQEIRQGIWENSTVKTYRQMFDCFDDARAFECRYAKDRVFALLGIFNHGRKDPFHVPYGSSDAEIFEAFARYCLKYGDTVDILSYAGKSNHAFIGEDIALPSWVPDWRLPLKSPIDMLHNFKAGHALSSSLELDESSKQLLTRGKLVDRVVAFVNPIESFREPAQAAEWTILEPAHVPTWYMHVEKTMKMAFGAEYGKEYHYIGGGDIWEALARSLVLDTTDLIFDHKLDRPQFTHPLETAAIHDEFSGFRGFRSHMLAKLNSLKCEIQDLSEPNLTILTYEQMEYHSRVVLASGDRGFYVTRKGYIGLGPKGIKPGDVICILAGSSVPYVLRPLQDEFHMAGEGTIPLRQAGLFQMPNGENKQFILRAQPEKYHLIGECYTHGLMRGEVWNVEHSFFEEFRII